MEYNIDSKINELKESRSLTLDGIKSLQESLSVSNEQDSFNNSFLFNEDFSLESELYDPAVQDLIKLYYTEKNIEDGTTFSHPSLESYTKGFWDDLLKNALNPSGDGIFYPFMPGADVSSSITNANIDPNDVGGILSDVDNKIDKVTSASEDAIAVFNNEGGLKSGNKTIDEIISENVGLDPVTTQEAEEGTVTDVKSWSPANVKTAIRSLGNYTHEQDSPSYEWVINHELDRFPSVMVKDSIENHITGEVKYINNNKLELHFTSEVSGIAYLS